MGQSISNRTGFMGITSKTGRCPIDPEFYSGQCTHTGTSRNPRSGDGSQNLCQTTSSISWNFGETVIPESM